MKRKVLALTGSRAEYGSMRPVFRAIRSDEALELDLAVTGMHLLPDFRRSLEEIRRDSFGRLHELSVAPWAEGGKAMAQALAQTIIGVADVLEATAAEIVLLQGDRGEMLAGAIAAAHMNVPIAHMSGGDLSGTIDQPVRNAITQLAHVHLASCSSSSERLRRLGEDPRRIFEVGEPSLDAILGGEYAGADELIRRFDLDSAMPVIMATLHPVTTEAADAGQQMAALLDALEHLGMQTVFTYPNTDAGGLEMRKALEARRGRKWLRIEPHIGSRGYLGLMRIAAVIVGNSSSGILEAPSFRLPAVNIGTRQYGRERAANVIDVGYSRDDILEALRTALEDADFRARAKACTSPYGDGHAGEKTAAILRRLRLSRRLVEKWLPSDDGFSD